MGRYFEFGYFLPDKTDYGGFYLYVSLDLMVEIVKLAYGRILFASKGRGAGFKYQPRHIEPLFPVLGLVLGPPWWNSSPCSSRTYGSSVQL